MKKYQDIVLDNTGNAILSATVTVSDNGGGTATIYSDNGITATANPFTASAIDGAYSFYAPNGRYDVNIVATGFTTENLTDIVLYDPDDLANIADLRAIPTTPNIESATIKGRTTDNDGGQGEWFWDSTSVETDNGGTILKATSIITGRWKRLYSGAIYAKWFGAIGDGTTDDSVALQAAADSLTSGGTLILKDGDFRVSKQAGTNDKWGLNITNSDVTIKGENASLRRLSTDISTYALSFPILLIGVPDDNATQITNVKVKGINFKGEDTRHAVSGNALMDGRQAIWIKNVKRCRIIENDFDDIDSSSIWIQSPGEYDYENAAYYNTTKSYKIMIFRNTFEAVPHAVAGRALMHVINGKPDMMSIIGNDFEWCDCCLNTDTTYDDYDDKETDTYTDSNLAATVKRAGRGLIVKGNTVTNSSEHCFYLNSMNIACSGNTIQVDDSTTCNTTQIQVRGRGVTVTNNSFSGVARAVHINTGSMDVIFSNNTIQAFGDSSAGIIGITSAGLTSYIDGRSDYFASYKSMKNITIGGNTVEMPNAAQTNGVGIRIYTDSADANFPDGQMVNVSISGNTINRPRKAIYALTNMIRSVRIFDNTFTGKDFTEATFTTGTTMNSEYVLGADDSLVAALTNISFDNNRVYGFEYILFDEGGAGGAGTFSAPYGVRGNRFSYIKYWDTAAFALPTYPTMFTNNVGQYFLDRTGWYSNKALFNSLSDGTANTEMKSMMQLVSSTDVRIYHDDAAGYKAL